MNLELFVDNALIFLNDWGFIIVIVFGIIHPLLENPLALFNLSLAIAIMGVPLAYITVFLANLIGILLLFYFTRMVNNKSDNFLSKKKISGKVLDWIKTTETWKHIVVIGVPMIPTYPIKLAVPLSGVSFRKYMTTLVGAYLFLFFGNTLIYFGVTGFISETIPNWVSFSLLLILVLYIYFGKYLFRKELDVN